MSACVFGFSPVFIVVDCYGHQLELGFLPGCPVWHICVTFMLTNKFDLIDVKIRRQFCEMIDFAGVCFSSRTLCITAS